MPMDAKTEFEIGQAHWQTLRPWRTGDSVADVLAIEWQEMIRENAEFLLLLVK